MYSYRLTDTIGTFKNHTEQKGTFYAPDIKVLLGAKWNSNQWLWSDGTIANFKPLNSCQQKAFSYEVNGWKTVNVGCTTKAYYACQINFKPEVHKPKCNMTSETIKWPQTFANIAQTEGYKVEIEIKIKTKNWESVIQHHPYNLQINFNLRQNAADYSIKVSAIFTGCSNFTIESTLEFTTATKISTTVIGAKVVSSMPCVIQVPYNNNSSENTSYIIVGKSSVNSTTHIQKIKVDEKITIDLKDHMDGVKVVFTIKDLTDVSCNDKNEFVSVNGSCLAPSYTNKSICVKNSDSLYAAVGSISAISVAIIIALLGIIYSLKKKTVSMASSSPSVNVQRNEFPQRAKPNALEMEDPYMNA